MYENDEWKCIEFDFCLLKCLLSTSMEGRYGFRDWRLPPTCPEARAAARSRRMPPQRAWQTSWRLIKIILKINIYVNSPIMLRSGGNVAIFQQKKSVFDNKILKMDVAQTPPKELVSFFFIRLQLLILLIFEEFKVYKRFTGKI